MRGNPSSKSSVKNFTPFFFILALLSLGVMIYFFTRPAFIEESRLENTIHIKTDYQMVEKVPPNLLYPGGTTLYPDKTLTTALANDFLIKETVTVTADKPVVINATSEPVLNIENKGTWEKAYPIGAKRSFNNHGTNSTINIEMTIPAKELFSYLDQVKKKLGLLTNNYVFHVKPDLKGTVAYQGTKFDLDGTNGLDFDYIQNELTLQDNEKLTYTKSYPIKEILNRPNEVTFMSQTFPVKQTRTILIIMVIVFALLWLFAAKRTKQHQSEYVLIDKKYEKHLIRVTKLLDMKNIDQLELLSFKDILLVSDEKETPIFRYENEHEVTYFVPNHQFVYNYKLPIEGRTRKK